MNEDTRAGTTPAGMRVVVGVSARSSSAGALRWAADLVASSGGELVALRAWRPMAAQAGSRGTPSEVVPDSEAARAAAVERLHHDVAEVLGPDHPATAASTVRLVVGGRRRALLSASEQADLLVVDAPRVLDAGSPPGFLHRLVQGAHCPVVVIPRSRVRIR